MIKNFLIKSSTFLIVLTILIAPVISLAVEPEEKEKEGLVPCGTKYEPYGKDAQSRTTGGTVSNPCGFYDLIELANRIITFIVIMTIPIVAIMFCYAGVLLLFSGGESGKKTKAKEIIWYAVLGLVLVFCAYIIVLLVLKVLGFKGTPVGF